MHTIQIDSSIQPYTIFIGNGIRHQLGTLLEQAYTSILIVTDSNVATLYAEDIVNSIQHETVYVAKIEAGEKSKSIDMFYDLHTTALEYGLDRNSLIIALGGGVIGDLAGFVAATFMRGIDFVQIPTTLLAHDSSVGGKVAINHELGKNLIGNFYPPTMVLYDIDTIQTLPQKELRSGYAELIKEAMLADKVFYERLLSVQLNQLTGPLLANFVTEGIQIKAHFVQLDEKETASRKMLNLGHTLAHALEAIVGYGRITHGEAVAIGILFASYVSEQEFQITLPIEPLYNWMVRNNYPVSVTVPSIQEIIEHMKHDKKTINQEVQMILLRDISKPVLYTVSDQKLKRYLHTFLTTNSWMITGDQEVK